MKTIDKYLTMLVRGVIGVALIVLFVVAFSVIIGRIFFDASMGWSQDVIRLCFTYIIYLGAAYCVREKGHLNVDFVLGMMKPQVRKAVEFVINIVLLAFFAFIVYYGFQFAATGASQKSPYLMIPMTYYYYGVPICFALGIVSIGSLIASGMPLIVTVQRMFTGGDSIALIAIPLFMLSGELMFRGGMSKRLVDFADTLLGHFPSGLAMVSILACMFFAAITGSAIAATAAIGGIMIPLMKERGYEYTFSAPLLACGGSIGPIIPPSIPLLVYGVLASVSVADLYVGGVIPGILMGIGLMIYSYFVGKKRGYMGRETRASFREVVKSAVNALLALFMPVIILGGIMSGKFSPTEAAAVATAYALVIGLFVYHELDLKGIWEAFVNAAKSTGQILIIVALASLFSWVITVAQIPQTVSAFLQANIHSKVAMLLVINVILLIAGTFIDTTSAIVIFAPLFIPICKAMNVDLVHFGMIMTVNLTIGMCTPPLGVCLFVSSSIAKISLKDQMRDLLPMLAVLIGVLLLVTYIPGLTLWLPSLFK